LASVYLDYNATAPIDPAALEAMADAARLWANPSSVHGPGRAARARLEEARRTISRRLDVDAGSLFFTSGGTEALDLVLRAPGHAALIVSAVEHEAVRSRAAGAAVLPVDGCGLVDLEALEAALAVAPRPALVCVMQANNETGVIQPLADVARIVDGAGGRLLVDAVQAAGKLPLEQGDYVAVSAHKLGGPPGAGALVVRDPARFSPAVRGAQERGVRGGTENLPAIAGFAAALDARAADAGWYLRATELRDRMEAELLGLGFPLEVVGHAAPRLGTTSALRLEGVPATTQLMLLDLEGLAVSAGAACSSGKVASSHVLRAMGYPEAEAGEAIRVSLGWGTTPDHIRLFTAAYAKMGRRLARARAA
jgi:cysteine desulfurase